MRFSVAPYTEYKYTPYTARSHCWWCILLVVERHPAAGEGETPRTSILLDVERDTLCRSILLVRNRYTLLVNTDGSGNDTPCKSILLAVEMDTPCTSILLALERNGPCTSILLVVEMDTPCTSILLAVERDTPCTVRPYCWRGRGYTVHPAHTFCWHCKGIHPACP